MPRKRSSVGVLQKFISKNQNTIGFTSSGGGGNSALVQKLQSYIDVNVKPYFITDYLNNDTADLDNYILNNSKTLKKGIELSKKFYETEASGGVTLKNIKKIASTGVKRISIGQITHSPSSINFKLEI